MPARRSARSERSNPVGPITWAVTPRQATSRRMFPGVLRYVRLKEGDRDHQVASPRLGSVTCRWRPAATSVQAGGDSAAAAQRKTWMAWFENLIDPLPDAPVVRPPDTVWAFYLHFIRPVKWLMLAVLRPVAGSARSSRWACSSSSAGWSTGSTRRRRREFFADARLAACRRWRSSSCSCGRWSRCCRAAFNNLALVPGLHRPACAGRTTATCCARASPSSRTTSPAASRRRSCRPGRRVRDTVGSSIDSMWTFVVYVGGMVYLFGRLDPLLDPPGRRLARSLTCITGLKFVPQVKTRSAAQAEANSVLSGPHRRQLHQHPVGQAVRPCRARGRFRAGGLPTPDRAPTATSPAGSPTMMVTLMTHQRRADRRRSAACRSGCGRRGSVTVGGIAIATSLVIRLNQMSNLILRNITGLFEDVGLGAERHADHQPAESRRRRAGRRPLRSTRGEIRFENVRFHYGREARRHRRPRR